MVSKISLSEEEWKKKLTPEQFSVLRRGGTERAGTSSLLEYHGKGTFVCAGCGVRLFSGKDKFESGTGWPSFVKPLKEGW